MVVCGDDALAHRLAAELRDVYGERVTLVVPSAREPHRPRIPPPARALDRATALLGRVSAAVARTSPMPSEAPGDGAEPPEETVRILEAAQPDDLALTEAGVAEAGALALVYDDDELNIHAALRARRLNPRLRLVIRLYNRKLGQHLEELLDQAAAVAGLDADGGGDAVDADASTTVLSDADTVAPALVATAVAGTSKVIEADGLLLRAAERPPVPPGRPGDPGVCTLALLPASANDPDQEPSSAGGEEGLMLLPDEAAVADAAGCGTVVLETVSYTGRPVRPARLRGRGAPLASLFSRRLRWSLAGVVGAVLALAVASWFTTGLDPVHGAYLTLLDLFAINDPALGQPLPRKILQLLSGLTGLLLLPVLVAAAFEGLGTFRSASALRRPPRGLSGHVVLLGLGKVGTRVLARLHEMGIPVVCIEADPEARGIALARRLRVPTVLGDVTQEGVLEAALIERAASLLALSSADTTNLEAALYARSVTPRLRVTLRLFDDRFATAVYRTLRAAHPGALTRSRSTSFLAAPAFGGAMMGRQILGAIPVERRVLLVARVEVRGNAALEGRTVAEVLRPGRLRVLAVATSAPDDPEAQAAAAAPPPDAAEREPARLVHELGDGYVLRPQDRVLLVATRQGLGDLHARQPRAAGAGARQG
ncbi:voltage-gated potassium channel Kch [Streptomyces sp. 2333.5]|uniref:NAD-binding protein n=1 Tax=unclassified Streptomyces TaxID=2593676 RepID=UPI00089CC22A|nr:MULTISPECIES: NAD-binding protein [unclassified Streptomyces]PJJ04972.1 voltage-gated potassium channel Kch [Streptomyces sp. 2333.5]SEE65077.1 Voltage-gated potassium channel Kch [Streptomyces sp. 2314.4]SEE91620.1 Voltage-gated potassium channel Kch [Streptomyces sp. 2112.2]